MWSSILLFLSIIVNFASKKFIWLTYVPGLFSFLQFSFVLFLFLEFSFVLFLFLEFSFVLFSFVYYYLFIFICLFSFDHFYLFIFICLFLFLQEFACQSLPANLGNTSSYESYAFKYILEQYFNFPQALGLSNVAALVNP